ncbi:AMP-binding protein [Brevibacterium jeotgali]|uniref:Fatty-acyl-CoA synthase n=1 Tax=Brevibacterium jeotgali TaxID=1262550 RepID=A0A2H1L3W8_9MICO|nr:AMP-binding protein [Brevibacterium jeotgali]TWC01847.1 fatty-acyl-CoA synthase [Brevibacterium jeotgali]SMY11594.1 fatty-acyl-CoA synthase [Brevibacterium jeotgali]
MTTQPSTTQTSTTQTSTTQTPAAQASATQTSATQTPGTQASATPSPQPATRTMGELLYSAFTRFDRRTAFVDGDRTLTYAQSAARVQAIRDSLRAAGVKPGDYGALLGSSRPETFFSTSALYLEGLRVSPLHPENGIRDHRQSLELAQVQYLLYEQGRFDDMAGELAATVPGLIVIPVEILDPATSSQAQGAEAVSGFSVLDRPVRVDPESDASLGFSGGTTGTPKGIVRSHRTMVTNALFTVIDWEWPADNRFLVTTPMSHASGAMALPILLQGGSMVMLDKFSPQAFVDAVAEHRISSTFLVPTMIYRLLDLPQEQLDRLSSLETVVYGASLMDPSRMQEALTRIGQVFLQLYGQSEAPNLITVLRREDHDPTVPGRLASAGRATSCADLTIRDDEDREVPIGEVGEVCVSGPIVMTGYWQNPELTAETLRDGRLHTGDLGRLDEHGFLSIVGRKKDMIITGGLNVYPAEVEARMLEHPAVAEACVVGIPDADWGERVVAAVVLRDETAAEVPAGEHGPAAADLVEEIRAFVREEKGSVQTPKDVVFVENIPVTKIGKPDKKAMQEQLAASLT